MVQFPEMVVIAPLVIDKLNDPAPSEVEAVNVHAELSVTSTLLVIPAHVRVQPDHVVPLAAAEMVEPEMVHVSVT